MTLELAKRIRKKCVEIAQKPTGCHLGGSLSVADILAVLFEKFYDEKRGDVIILSKGHSAAALYATLYESGLIADDPAKTYGDKNSIFTGHPNNKIPHIPFATGSLGHGPALGLGWAMGQRFLKNQQATTYIIIGDGELQEGSCWETFQVAIAQNIKNLVIIIDNNQAQNDGWIKDICPLGDLYQKARSFGFQAINIDGHDHLQITQAIIDWNRISPLFIVAKTIKGKGFATLENNHKSHYVTAKPAIAQSWIQELTA